MRNSYLQPTITKLQKRSKKIIYADELKSIIEIIMSEAYNDKRAYKLIYHLKNKGFLYSLKKNIFLIKGAEDDTNDNLLTQDRYRTIVRKHCSDVVGNARYIGGVKAFEICFNNFDIPDELQVVTYEKQGIEIAMFNKQIVFKKYTNNKISLFPIFKKFTKTIKIGNYSFRYAIKELAVLESLYNYDDQENRYAYELVKKALKKTKEWDIHVWDSIMKAGKHHSSINRLYDIAKQVNPKLADELLISIKKYSFILDV